MPRRILLSIVLLIPFIVQEVNGQVKIPSESQFELERIQGDLSPEPYTVSLIGIASENYSETKLKLEGVRIGSRVGDYITVRVASNNLTSILNSDQFDYLQLAQKIKPQLSRAVPDTRADSVHQGYMLEQAYSGKDVIIGVTDWGFDYTHPMFYDTSLSYTRILAAWDQNKTSGPRPENFDYGTEWEGESELLAAQSDTAGVYSYGTHGTHVAGIAGGSGAGTEHRGLAFDANFLFVQFLVDEAAVLDAFAWMYEKSVEYEKRLVINMSWSLHHFGTLDGNSVLSRAIDEYSGKGVVFVGSGGNNGNRNFHLKHNFLADTVRTGIDFYPFNAHEFMWGQSISFWGQVGEQFGTRILVLNKNNQAIAYSDYLMTNGGQSYLSSEIVIGGDTISYNLSRDSSHPLNDRSHMRLRIQNKENKYKVGLEIFANQGLVHLWNVTELSNDVGNWGMPFSSFKSGWMAGDNQYAVSEPSCTKSVISVAAHNSEIRLPDGRVVGGALTSFSSEGPTLDERIKPDISAPGSSIASSVSSFTDDDFDLFMNVNFNGKDYPFSKFSGTSMSGPAVAGVVALILEANPNLMPLEVKEIIQMTARYDENTGNLDTAKSTEWGWGKINASQAVIMAEMRRPSVEPPLSTDENLLYPNPNSGELFLYSSIDELVDIEVFDSKGRKVMIGKIGSLNPLDISLLLNGMYYCSLPEISEIMFKIIVIE